MEPTVNILASVHERVGGHLYPTLLRVGRCTLWEGPYRMQGCGPLYYFMLDEYVVDGYTEEDEGLPDRFAEFVSNPEPWLVVCREWGYFREKMRLRETFIEGYSQYLYGIYKHNVPGMISWNWIRRRATQHGVQLSELQAIDSRIHKAVAAQEELRR